MATVKVKEAIRRLKRDGWYLSETEGSHQQYRHFVRLGKVTVANHGRNLDIPERTWMSIQRQAGWR